MNTLGIINYRRINTILSTHIPHSLRFYDSTRVALSPTDGASNKD